MRRLQMGARDIAAKIVQKARRAMGLPVEPNAHDFAISSDRASQLAEQTPGHLAKVFFSGNGRLVNKWVHFLEIYETHFSRYRGTPVRMLEIGVSKGGSLDMWRNYFGPQAVLFGIDVDPACAGRVSPPNQVRIGSQDDPTFLRSVVAEMGGEPDVVLDDGSHVATHQRVSFDTLFPLLKAGGLYVMEDLHTAYWPGVHEGGYRRRGTAVEFVKQMIDDMHGWYHRRPTRTPAKESIFAVHAYDSIVVIEKRTRERPGHIMIEPAASGTASS